MSTDLYGARVLDVADDRRSVRLRVFVVYNEPSIDGGFPLPDDAVFFLRLLWDFADAEYGAPRPLARAFGHEPLMDEAWVAVNSRWFIEGVDRLSTRNHPMTDEQWDTLAMFYRLRDGGWQDEDQLVQGDYVVRVTDPRWIDGLELGDTCSTVWGVGFGATEPDDAAYVPDFTRSAHLIEPFRAGKARQASEIAFSDDGNYLALLNWSTELVVYETSGWTERLRLDHGVGLPSLMWVPGRPVVTVKSLMDDEQWAYDMEAGAVTEVPHEPGNVRSRTGRYRARYLLPGVEFLDVSGAPDDSVTLPDDIDPGRVRQVAFDDEGSQMLLISQDRPDITVVETETGRIRSRIATDWGWVSDVAVTPGGRHVLISQSAFASDDQREPSVWRMSDGRPVLRGSLGRQANLVAWSPDGRWVVVESRIKEKAPSRLDVFPVGLPVEPPAELRGVLTEGGESHGHAHDPTVRPTAQLIADTKAQTTEPQAETESRTAASRRAGIARQTADRLCDEKDWAGALTAYQRSVDAWRAATGEEYPHQARWGLLYLAQMHGMLHDFERSRPLQLKLLEIFAESQDREEREIAVIAALRMGLDYKEERKLAEAEPWFQQVIDSGDRRHIPTAVAHLAELHYQIGDKERSARLYERALEISDDPEFVAEAAYRLGEYLAEAGDPADTARVTELMKIVLSSGFDGFDDNAQRLLARIR
ncbi:WD40 repeat domain-containing protein [Nonomuraea guangzhouensis]|uniref:WD40 repeat domain-containing protein n=1 Tax=Nonomuraea guangzhouensis TaxID=1291555 RepID=A0ABW4GX65_9ACTN|nr:WD40 repeat domain-containing protein [Nonomuraea guangzhouensis]